MRGWFITGLLICSVAQAVIVDRIAIVVGKKIIKDSDIIQDLRLTDFLNKDPLAFTPAARKKSANRLVDQALIREALESGDYPEATVSEAQNTLASLIKSRYPTSAAYKSSLAMYGISETELKERLLWQLTVLRFIDARFRPSANADDEQVKQYYEAHKQQFVRGLEVSRAKIEEILSGENTNKEFYDWLDQRRKSGSIRYLEEGLQ